MNYLGVQSEQPPRGVADITEAMPNVPGRAHRPGRGRDVVLLAALVLAVDLLLAL